jgi:hypothetical protein
MCPLWVLSAYANCIRVSAVDEEQVFATTALNRRDPIVL